MLYIKGYEMKTEISGEERKKISLPDTRILIFINTSWGEIDWILPVCNYIKNNYPEARLTVLFNALDVKQIIKGNEPLLDLLSESVHNIYTLYDFLPRKFQRFFNLLKRQLYEKNQWQKLKPVFEHYGFGFFKLIAYKRAVKTINPNVLLKDVAPDRDLRKRIVTFSRKRGCREVMFPHAPELHDVPSNWVVRPELKADDILCNTEWMTRMFSKGDDVYKNHIHVVGIPRYDEWWINRLQQYWRNLDYMKYTRTPKSIMFLFFTQEAHTSVLFSEEVAEQIIHEVVDTILSFKNSFVIVKPHPRQNFDLLKKRLEKYDATRIVIDQSPAMYLSSFADVIICMGESSVIMDALTMEKPVIEYYKYTNIQYEDEYVKLGFVAPAYSTNDLREWIKKMKLEQTEEHRAFINKFRAIVPKSYDDATKKSTNIILGIDHQ
jgi:CDP-glycerol glycerophosphotransferase (TagB/SpsB family)